MRIHSQHSEKSFFFQKHDFEIYISEKVSQNSEYLSHISDLFFSELWLIYTKITDILSYNSDFFCIQKPKKVSNDLVYFLFCGRNRRPYILVPFERVAPQYQFFTFCSVSILNCRCFYLSKTPEKMQEVPWNTCLQNQVHGHPTCLAV